MNQTTLICGNEKRPQIVRDQAESEGGLNGIDYVEVIEGYGQRKLCVHLFGDVPEDLVPANVRIECGERIRDIKVLTVELHQSEDPDHEDCLRVTVDKAGDFSCYKLCFYDLDEHGHTSARILRGFDPRYSCATFSFKVDCPAELDCKAEDICPPVIYPEPEINYLAKDYASFRQLILDRLALIMPDWRERHVPDIGIALVEILAYTGDYLSYYQDAAATEAYLDTARQRISVRRHARLVDYFMHEGCNARAWICVEVDEDVPKIHPKDFYFITGCEELADIENRVVSAEDLGKLNILPGSFDVFEPLVANEDEAIQFYASHTQINFYTWGDAECCLEPGSTRATLIDSWETESDEDEKDHYINQKSEEPTKPQKRTLRHLKVNDVLIFEEVIGPKTNDPADADPAHKWAVRLTRVSPWEDPLTGQLIVEIEWDAEDALPFALCLSARLQSPDCRLIENISVACGNVVLADHGQTFYWDIDEKVPTIEIAGDCSCEGSSVEFTEVPGEFPIMLQDSPLTYFQMPAIKSPASTRLKQDPRKALAAVALYQGGLNTAEDKIKPVWHPKFDLLASDQDDRDFVVEIDNDRRANIRFGDGECGRMPEAGSSFQAKYRIGNGQNGNVGAGTITFMVTRNPISGASMRPRNPMATQGGTDAEPVSEVKLFAPGEFRKQIERAITADDYAELAKRNSKVQRAAAKLAWNGSWYEAQVAVDPFGAESLGEKLKREIEGSLYRYRRIGHDLSADQARYVPLDIALTVCVSPDYLRGHVRAELADMLSSRVIANGRKGVFHPDNLTFGDGIYLSSLVAAAQAVEGVVSAEISKLQRLFESANGEISNGILPLSKSEIAQLDNNPNFPERGRLTLILKGGR